MRKRKKRPKLKIFHTAKSNNIKTAIAEAIVEAQCESIVADVMMLRKKFWRTYEPVVVEFDFDGVTIIVTQNSDADLVYRDWDRAKNGYIDKIIGPDYNTELPPEELTNCIETKPSS